MLQSVAESCPQIERGTFESHRGATAKRRDAGDHAGRERAQREGVLGVVKRLQVLVGGRG